MSDERARYGVDTGGTFTDVVCLDGRQISTHKLLSTPDDPSRAIADGIISLQMRAHELVHGTTVATNALLERKGAELAFVTTRGFEDLLILRRQNRPHLYDFDVSRPASLVGEYTFGVTERVLADGSIETVLEEQEVEELVQRIAATPVEAVAICLLHSYANSEHERRLAKALREALPRLFVTASHEVLPQFREYERASTTAVNAFVGPIMSGYLGRLTERLEGCETVDILQSNGGRASAEYVRRFPVHTVLSGPAGGVVGAWSVAEELGLSKIVTLDMGGTSTDVSLVDGALRWTQEAEIDGLPVHVPVTDIATVGAGGGSIAHRDRGGALRVGPESAGADPGPAAYGRGAGIMTVTDAHLLLGRLRADDFLSGEMQLDAVASQEAARRFADELEEPDLNEVATNVIDIANSAMVRAIKTVSVERGHDPSEFTLVAFGGAGGLHAAQIADELEIDRVVIPRLPGLLSAFGMLRADTVRVVSGCMVATLDEVLETRRLGELLERLEAELAEMMGENDFETNVEAELRYQGQSFEITIPVDWSSENAASDPAVRFESEHRELFGYTTDRSIELVAVRMVARIRAPSWSRPEAPTGSGEFHETEVVFDRTRPTRIYERDALPDSIDGPAIITEYSATTVVPPGWRLSVRAGGHLVMERA